MRVWRIFLISLLVMLLFSIAVFADEDENYTFSINDLDNAIEERNAIIRELKDSGHSAFSDASSFYSRENVNEDYYVKYGLIVNSKLLAAKPVFDLPSGLFQELDFRGEYRYLGKNSIGEIISNPFHEAVVSNNFEKKNWIKNDDYENIKKTLMGKGLRDDNPFNDDEFIERYYSNFITAFVKDFGEKLSDEFMLEFNKANKEFIIKLGGRDYLSLSDDEKKELDEVFKYVGQSANPRNSDEKVEYPMKDFIRIASIPGDFSNGLAYMFHRANNGVYYYLGLRLDSNYMKYEDAIAVDSNISIDGSDYNYAYGKYSFDINSNGDIKSYKIRCLDSGVVLDGKLDDNLELGTKEYSDTYDLIAVSADYARNIRIEIEVENLDGKKARHLASVYLPSKTESLNISTSSVIASNKRGQEIYDVSKGIPSDSDLYCNIIGEEYVSNSKYRLHRGKKVFQVHLTKTYNLKWKDPISQKEESELVTLNRDIRVTRDYSYYTIANFGLYRASRAKVYSDVFEGGFVDIEGSRILNFPITIKRYEKHVVNTLGSYNIIVDLPSQTIDGGDEKPAVPPYNFSSAAENFVPSLLVRNDKVVFKGLLISDGRYVETSTARPLKLPKAKAVDIDFFYKEDNKIPTMVQNKLHDTRAEIIYEAVVNINSPSEEKREVSEINKVFVHSPVVAYPKCESRLDIIQKEELDESLSQLVIGDSFNINFSTLGSHRDIPGYGNRDYSSTTRAREVKFSFDVFKGKDYSGEYFKKGEWIEITEDDTRFFIPSWVHEADLSNIYFRALANNYPNGSDLARNFQRNHNILHNAYKAVELIRVALVSKVYDFKISDLRDPSFNKHFSKKNGYFKVGDKNHFGKEDVHRNYLPINGYKNSENKYYGQHLKLGYKFRYSFKTSGDMVKRGDIAVVKPIYKVLDKDGNLIDVDLYYKKRGRLKAISYKLTNAVVLNAKGRKIAKDKFKNTAFVRAKFLKSSSYSKEYKNLIKKQGHNINFYGNMLLSSRQRLYIGKLNRLALRSGLKREDLLAAVQEWHGDFYLPSSTVAVRKGTKLSSYKNLDVKKAPFLQEGLIIVNFQIELYHNVKSVFDIEKSKPYISYSTQKYGNQWKREGYQIEQRFGDSNRRFNYGDVAVYYLNKRAYENYK